MRHPQKNKVAKVPTKSGGSYSYNYADLADVIDAVRGPFASNGLAFVQVPFCNERTGRIGIVTRIMHTSGQWIEGTLFMSHADDKPQTIGSAITYGRRYALSPMAGIASDDDDDGNAAQGHEASTSRRPGRDEPQYKAPGDSGQTSRPSSTLPETTTKMLGAFTALGVTREALESYLETPLTKITNEQLAGLKGLYADVQGDKIKVADIGSKVFAKADTKATLDKKFKK
jgi:hypothetical protein